MSTEVASTRLPSEMIREIDHEAAARGLSRSVYLAHLIERGITRDALSAEAANADSGLVRLATELRELRQAHGTLYQAVRDIQAALDQRAPVPAPVREEPLSPLVSRLAFSTFFSETLIRRIGAVLYRNPSELAQVVREAREQATAETRLWHERGGAAVAGKEAP